MIQFDVVVVGGGHAGVQLCVSLAAGRFAGSVALVSDESDLPYERPPLTKGYLSGDVQDRDLWVRDADWWAESPIKCFFGSSATSVDGTAHVVELADGTSLSYRTLVWAAGGEAKRLNVTGHDLDGVHVIRKRSDAVKVKEALSVSQRAVVIGGGYIGLESAASLRRAGLDVTVVEALDRVLARVTGTAVATYVQDVHRREGVTFHLGTGVDMFEGRGGQVTGVRLTTGEVLPADLVVVGIGLAPSIGPLRHAGAEVGDGVVVDEMCRTSLPDVYAIGDCASFPSMFAATPRIRLESVQNANDQARTVSQSLLGCAAPYTSLPWFWSNQYDERIQTVGVLTDFDMTIVRGNPAAASFSVVYLRAGIIVAVDSVNNSREYAQARRIIGMAPADLGQLADAAISLKDLELAPSPADERPNE